MPADPPGTVHIAIAHDRHIGANHARPNLEDASEATPLRLGNGELVTLGMIADGMGGIEGGEVASRTAVETALTYLQHGSPDNLPALMHGALLDAQQRVLGKRKEMGFARMGTTATLALITPDARLYLAHVGDSRAYLVRGTSILQLTLDHTWGNEQVRRGKLSPAEAATHDRRDSLNRYIGQNKALVVDLGIWLDGGDESQQEAEARQGYPLLPGDTIVLCSDGLIKERVNSQQHFVEPEEIVEIVGSLTPNDAAHRLVNLAVERGVDDNVSVVVMYVQGRTGPGAGLDPTLAPGVNEALKKDAIRQRLMADSSFPFEPVARPAPEPGPPPPPEPASPVATSPEPGPLPEPAHPTRPRRERQAARPAPRSRRLTAGIVALLVVAALLVMAVLVVAFVLPALEGSTTPGGSPAPAGPGIPVSQASGTIRYTTGGAPRPVGAGDTLPADRHVVLTFEAGSRARLDLPDGTKLYAGDEVTELWLTPNPNAGQGSAPATMVRLITGRLLVAAGDSGLGGFTLYNSTETPWVELQGATMGVRRIVDRAAGIEEVTVECLDGACLLLAPQTLSVAACQRVKLASGEIIPPSAVTADSWTRLAGADLPASALCGG